MLFTTLPAATVPLAPQLFFIGLFVVGMVCVGIGLKLRKDGR
jgi:hypothetical protein